jgi:hypothetical protein
MTIGDIYNGDRDEGKEELGVNKGNDALRSFSHLSMTNTKPRWSPGSRTNSNDVAELMSTIQDIAMARSSSDETQKEILMLCVCVCRPPVTGGVTVTRTIPIASDPPPMTPPQYPGTCNTTPLDPRGGMREGFPT